VCERHQDIADRKAYQNAAKSDFDDWNMPGWSFDELLPTIRKVRIAYHLREEP